MSRYQVQSNMTINNPNGVRAKIVMKQAFFGVFVSDDATRTDWTIRANNYITPAPGYSSPTGNAIYSWRNHGYVAATIASWDKQGVNGIRIGVDPAMFKVQAYTDPNNGRNYPSELEMLDTIIDCAARYGMMVNLTCAMSYIPVSNNVTFLQQLATRYASNGCVVFNPNNEINCNIGNPTLCANTSTWASTMTQYINAIRGTGALNMIIINPPGQSSGNPCAGFSMAPILTAIASSPFSTDPNLCYGIHHYRYPFSGVTTFDSAAQSVEEARWANYLSTYPIMIEETGISPDLGNHYDPEYTGTSYNITEWGYAQAEHSGFLGYCRNLMDTSTLNGVCVQGDNFYFGGPYLDNSLCLMDGTITTPGTIFNAALLPSPPVVSGPWTPYNPVINAASGTLTTYTVTGRYQKTGNTVTFEVTISITNHGTAAGYITASLPTTAASGNYEITGREIGVTGSALNAAILSCSNFMIITRYDNTYCGGNGYVLNVSGLYESA